MEYNCYQCDGDLGEIQAERKRQIREWADAQIAEADKAFTSLVGVPGEDSPFNASLGDIEIQTIPEEQVVPTEEEAQAKLNEEADQSRNNADLSVDATALGAKAEGDPVTVEEATAEKVEEKPAKKAPAHKK